jgi:hypothetical protein
MFTALTLQNVLMHDVGTPFEGYGFSVTGIHLTAHQGSCLVYGEEAGCTLYNSLIVGLNNTCEGVIYNVDSATVWLPTAEPIFEATALGGHYLPVGSSYRLPGTTGVDPELDEALKQKTTYAPVVLQPAYNGTLTLSQRVPRNNAAPYPIGYSYDPIDYVAAGLQMQSGTLLVTNGVVIGLDGRTGYTGIQVFSGAELVSQGSPVDMNRFIELRSIQEQRALSTYVFAFIHQAMSGPEGHVRLRFTELVGRAGHKWHILRDNVVGSIALTDCQIFNGEIGTPSAYSQEHTVAFTNNLFEFSKLSIFGSPQTHFAAFNNTFTNCTIILSGGTFAWSVRDNLFLNCSLTATPNTIGNSHNGYWNTAQLAGSGPNYPLTAEPNYRSGPLGNWYLPEGSCSLLNGGSRSPAAAGLYQHTTQVSQQKEGDKSPIYNVDVGYHYVAVKSDNLARYKYATQSTTDSGRVASRAIDGSVNGNATTGNSVSSTLSENHPWWQLDLGLPEQIGSVILWNRTDCCGNLLRNLYVLVSDDPFQSPNLDETLAQPGVSAYYVAGQAGLSKSITINRSGQHIRIQLTEHNPLALAEVQVYSPHTPIDTEGDRLPDYLEDRNGDGIVNSGETDFKGPIVTFTTPANGFSISTTRMNMRGTVSQLSSTLKSVTVNGINAFLSGNTFDVLNLPLSPGANKIIAVAEDINGNLGSASIAVLATGTLIDPVTLTATPGAGFDPLNVTFQVTSSAPGTFQDVQYDFNGDGTLQPPDDFTRTDLTAISHTYDDPGEYFPVATVRTTLGNFSSLGGFSSSPGQGRLRVSVGVPPVQQGSALSVTDPVDLKATPEGNLYVLSRSTATLTQFDSTHTVVRSISAIGTTPTGLDVDAEGKVYIALSGGNQVIRLRPIIMPIMSFELDPTFNGTGRIGKANGTPGSGNGEFNAPFDVTISPDGQRIVVSDSANHRIQQFTTAGTFITSFGQQGSALEQLNNPKGLTYDHVGYLYIIDSGNSRTVVMLSSAAEGASGALGSGLGQFQAPINLSVGDRGIYVADTGNNRVQSFESIAAGDVNPTPFLIRAVLSTETALNQPSAVSAVAAHLEEKVYIADTGNNRVILVRLPAENPEAVWTSMKGRLLAGDIEGAIPYFSEFSADKYRKVFLSIGTTELVPMMSQIPAISPIFIRNANAQYIFDQVVQGFTISFPIEFIKENGTWKILQY